MRVTDKMIANSYMTGLNKSYVEMNELNEKVAAGRKYMKASEDPATALKAYQVRENISRIDLYRENVMEAEGLITDLEASVASVNGILGNVREQLVKARTGSSNPEDQKIIAEIIRNYQSEILTVANAKYGDSYIFGGNQTTRLPFTLEADGTLRYQGVDVNSNAPFPEETLYFDIGLGLHTDAGGQVIPGTAMDIANPGSKAFGTGIDGDGLPNNLYNLLGEIATTLENGDMAALDTYMAKLEDRSAEVLIDYANIGQKSNFIEFLADRFSVDKTNALEKQQKLEGLDPAQGIIEFNMQEFAYKAALQMGAKIIQPSLLDFLR